MTVLYAPPSAEVARLRDLLRVALLALAAAAAAALVAVGRPAWAPLPLLAVLVDWQLRPWLRRAGGVRLRLGDTLVTEGPAAPPGAARPTHLALHEVCAATTWRRARGDHDELHIVLWTDQTAWHITATSPPDAVAADLDEIEARLGGLPGWERALAPAWSDLGRPFSDPGSALWRHLERALPPDSLNRLAARGWRADRAHPDPAGLLPAPHDDLLRVDLVGWRWGAASGALTVLAVHRDVRRQPVWSGGRARPTLVPMEVDVLLIALDGGLTLAVPTPAAAAAPRAPTPADAVFVHTAEVAPILLRLLRHDPHGVLAPVLTPAVL